MSQFSGQVTRISQLFNNGNHSSGGQNRRANEQLQSALKRHRKNASRSCHESTQMQPSNVNRIHQLLSNGNLSSGGQSRQANEEHRNVLIQQSKNDKKTETPSEVSKVTGQKIGLWGPGYPPYNFKSYPEFHKDIVVKIDQAMKSECNKENLIRLLELYEDRDIQRIVNRYNCRDPEFDSICDDARTAAYNFDILRREIFFDRVANMIRDTLSKKKGPQYKVKQIGYFLLYAGTGDKMGDHDVVMVKEVENTWSNQWYTASEKIDRLSSLFQNFKLSDETADFRRAREAGSGALGIVEKRTYFEKVVLKNTRAYTISNKTDKIKVGEIFSYLTAASVIKT